MDMSCLLYFIHRTGTVLVLCAFRHFSVAVWNNLPTVIQNCILMRSFRHNLKTFSFCTAFATWVLASTPTNC